MKKIILTFAFIVPVFLFSFGSQFALADSGVIATPQIQQEIQSLINQIVVLLQELMQLKSGQTQIQTQNNSATAVLTVNVLGVTAYVSINNGSQFAYVSPITLNNGDTYSVIASVPATSGSGNSTSKCSGIASPGGSYVCNINMGS